MNPGPALFFFKYAVKGSQVNNRIAPVIGKPFLIHDNPKNKLIKVRVVFQVFDQALKIGVILHKSDLNRLDQIFRFPFFFLFAG